MAVYLLTAEYIPWQSTTVPYYGFEPVPDYYATYYIPERPLRMTFETLDLQIYLLDLY